MTSSDLLPVNQTAKSGGLDRKKQKFYLYDYTQEVDYDEKDKESTAILEIDSIIYLNGFYSLKTYDLIHQEWKILYIPFEMKDVVAKTKFIQRTLSILALASREGTELQI